MDETPLDRAHAAMEAAPDHDRLRLRFYDRLADAELYLLLSDDQTGDTIAPKAFSLDLGSTVLAFDREDRLATFAEGAVPYAELTGRTLAPMLAEARLGLGLNLGVAPSAFLMPPDAIRWFADTLSMRPRVVSERPISLAPPSGFSEVVLSALEAKMPAMAGLAERAMLVAATYADGRSAPVLTFVGARKGAEAALVAAAGEAMAFSGDDEGALDVLFLGANEVTRTRFDAVALHLDLPDAHTTQELSGPGLDPNRPPRLR